MTPPLNRSLLALVALSAVASASGGPPPRRPAGAEDVLYLAPDRPLIVRFHTSVDGRPPGGPLRSELVGPMRRGSRGVAFAPSQEPDGAPLFARIDADDDGRLSRSEFQKAAETLHTLDLDDDETISTAELEPLGNPVVAGLAARPPASTARGVFIPVSAARSPRDLGKQLIDRYDRAERASEKDNRLSREELGLTEPDFEPFDLDGDGGLDFDELTQWIRRPAPAVEIAVRLGRREADEAPIHLIRRGDGLDARLRTSAAGPAVLSLGKMQIEIEVEPSTAGDQVVLQAGTEARNLFEILDLNGDHRLSVRELRAAARGMELWDRNGDGSISRSEIPTHVRLTFRRARPGPGNAQDAVSGSSRTGPAWFRMMDRNGDGDLSPREFLGRIEHFRALDADADGLIDAPEASAWPSDRPSRDSRE